MTKVELLPVHGDREAFLPLLLEADESEEMVRTYLKEGQLLAVEVDGTTAGEMLVIPVGVAPDGDRDSLRVVLLEALARGVPVVTTDSIEPEIVFDESTGRVVPVMRR